MASHNTSKRTGSRRLRPGDHQHRTPTPTHSADGSNTPPQPQRASQRDHSPRGGASSRRTTGRAQSTRARASKAPQQLALYTGGAVAAVLLLVAFAVLAGGQPRPARSPAAKVEHSGRITPEQARMLKNEGLQELDVGRTCLSRAGMPGTPGEQASLAEAKTHLDRAQSCFMQALEGLPADAQLSSIAEDCGRMLYTAQKRMVVGAH